jgi:hypothetical protein
VKQFGNDHGLQMSSLRRSQRARTPSRTRSEYHYRSPRHRPDHAADIHIDPPPQFRFDEPFNKILMNSKRDEKRGFSPARVAASFYALRDLRRFQDQLMQQEDEEHAMAYGGRG